MDDGSRKYGIVVLGIMGVAALVVAAVAVASGKEIPPGIAAICGTVAGAIAGLINPAAPR